MTENDCVTLINLFIDINENKLIWTLKGLIIQFLPSVLGPIVTGALALFQNYGMVITSNQCHLLDSTVNGGAALRPVDNGFNSRRGQNLSPSKEGLDYLKDGECICGCDSDEW